MIIGTGATLNVPSASFGSNFSGTLSLGASNGNLRFVGSGAVSTLGKFDLGTGSVLMNNRDGTPTVALGALAGGPNTTLGGSAATANVTTAITIGAANVDSTFNGRIINGTASGATVSLTKTGSGTFTLNGTSTYTGATTISSGTLQFNGVYLGTGAYAVNANLAGAGVINAQVNLSGGAIAPASDNIGALTVASLAVSSGNLNIQVGGGNADKLSVTGANGLSFTGQTNLNFNDNGATFGRYVIVDYYGTPLADLSNFTPTSGISLGGTSASLQNNALNTSVDLYIPNPAEVDSQWGVNGSGTWTNNANWTNNTAPNGVDNVATFGTINTTSASVDLPVTQTVALANFNSTGGYTITSSGGALNLNATGGYVGINVFGGNPVVMAPVTLGQNAIMAVTPASTLSIPGNISGSGGIMLSGGGVLSLSGSNSYSGPTILNSGTAQVSGNAALGDASATNSLVFAGGALETHQNFTSPASRGVQLATGGTIDATDASTVVEIDGVISGIGAAPLNKVGAGELILGGSNTYAGTTTVTSGTLLSGASNVIADNAGVVVNGATSVFDMGDSHTETVGGLRLDGGGTITATGASTLTLNSGSYDIRAGTVNVPLAGSAGLSKTTAGAATLLANASYTGATTINGGTLTANKVGGATLTVSSGSLKITSKGTPNSLAGTSVVTALSIATGGVASIDLANNAMIINYTGAVGTQVTDVRDHIFNGRLTSSAATGGLALGYADASVLGKTSFGGVSNDTTSVLVGLVFGGDANLDGTANALDFNVVASNYSLTGKVWTSGDFNYDGTVNSLDFNALAADFNLVLSNPPAPALGSLVPEPASLGAIAALALFGRRRRRR
jgi:autotransporter-associated beta strand protein